MERKIQPRILADHYYILLYLSIITKLTYFGSSSFDGLKDAFGWARNNYDEVGHFAQGFIPAIITREILLRKTASIKGKMLFFLAGC